MKSRLKVFEDHIVFVMFSLFKSIILKRRIVLIGSVCWGCSGWLLQDLASSCFSHNGHSFTGSDILKLCILYEWLKYNFQDFQAKSDEQCIQCPSDTDTHDDRYCHNPRPSPSPKQKSKGLGVTLFCCATNHPPPPTQTFLSNQTSNWAQIFTVDSPDQD